ncbi:hypothetical protein NIES4102_08060 [Chondrocystis sp. NIES-4102]|nr:hypothetical protein NIES4102_08060 [Chondrocystis sp. NIES-4102]
MLNSNDQISRKLGFFYLKSAVQNQYFCWLLTVLTFVLSSNLLAFAQPSLAQETTRQSLSLNKNVIYVDSKIGDDAQSGDKSSPVKTITQALKIATPGSTIQLTAGTYSPTTGETFPLVLKDQITIQGNAKTKGNQIVIEGNGYFISPTGAGQNIAIAALKDAGGLIGVTVINEHSRGHGLWIESSSPKVINNTFTRNGNTGVSINGNSSPLIAENYFYNNLGNGLLVYGTSKPEVVDNSFVRTGFGLSIVQDAQPIVKNNFFDSNRIAIILEGNSQGKFRDNEIINSAEYGLTAIAGSHADLGTDTEPGNNVFRSNQKLDIQNASDHQILAVGTKVTGETEGDINFNAAEFTATNQPTPDLPSSPTAMEEKTTPDLPLPQTAIEEKTTPDLPSPPTVMEEKTTPDLPSPAPILSEDTNPDLPSPPPVMEVESEDQSNTTNKELVFSASPSSSLPEAEIQPQPVPFPPDTTSTNTLIATQVKYKVLVEAYDPDAQLEVRSLFPQAFATIYQGKSVLQVGAFNNLDKAKKTQRSLDDLGLDTYILE